MARTDLVSETIGNFNIDNDLVYRVRPNDFGFLSKDDVISAAQKDGSNVGGIRLFNDDELMNGVLKDKNGLPDYAGKRYAVQITQDADEPLDNNKAYVYVPWLNTQYKGDGFQTILCVEEEYNLPAGMGGTYRFEIKPENIPIDVLSNAVKTEGENIVISSFTLINERIRLPLSTEISDLREEYKNALSNYYQKTETSSNTEIADLCILIHNEISDSFYAKNQINDISTEICATIDDKFALSSDVYGIKNVYNKSEINILSDNIKENINTRALSSDVYGKISVYTKSETSSSTELNTKFNTKQNNLTIRNIINLTDTSTTDIASLCAIVGFVNSSIASNAADFRGTYNSLNEVPRDPSKYKADATGNTEPNAHDYIVVDITDDKSGAWSDEIRKLKPATWRFKYTGEWEQVQISGWHQEYIITQDTFTDALHKALDSGITKEEVSKIISINDIKTRIEKDYSNLTHKFGKLADLDYIENNITGSGTVGKFAVFSENNTIKSSTIAPKYEEWTFEFLDPIKKVTKKVMLAE